jgi:hypothetical protein
MPMGCPIEYGRQPAATDRALYARCRRHALCQAQGFNSGDQFFAYLRDDFELLYAEGKTAPKMMSVGLHARLAGRLGRAAGLARFLIMWPAAPTSGSAAGSISPAAGSSTIPLLAPLEP